MGQTAKVTRKNRTITVDFHNEATYDQLLDDTKAFVEFVLAFLLALGFSASPQGHCAQSALRADSQRGLSGSFSTVRYQR
jgi:hypothetical protein